MAEFLPDNDRDLKLARRIGRYLEGLSSPVVDNDDPLAETLLAYKRHVDNTGASHPAPSRSIWNHINRHTQPAESSGTNIYRLNPYMWAAAACVLIAAFAGIFYFTSLQTPELLAEAGQDIKTINLSDGSEVTLRPHSRLYRIGEEDTPLYRLTGEGYFQVAPRSDMPFSVEAGNGRVRVLGTRFTLSSWGDITQVFLEEGSVQFTLLQSNESVVLEPGQSLTVRPDGRLPETTVADTSEYKDWMNSQLVFSNKPAGYVFSELEHHFGIQISAPEEIQSMIISSGGLTLEEPKTSLEYLGLVLGGNFRQTEQGTYIFEATE